MAQTQRARSSGIRSDHTARELYRIGRRSPPETVIHGAFPCAAHELRFPFSLFNMPTPCFLNLQVRLVVRLSVE